VRSCLSKKEQFWQIQHEQQLMNLDNMRKITSSENRASPQASFEASLLPSNPLLLLLLWLLLLLLLLLLCLLLSLLPVLLSLWRGLKPTRCRETTSEEPIFQLLLILSNWALSS